MRSNRLLILAGGLIVLGGCDDLDLIGVFDASSATETRTYAVIDEQTTGVDPAMLGTIAGALTRVRYEIGNQRRAYLFDGNLRSGITSGSMIRLPSLMDGATEHAEDLTTFGTNWNSVRIYDSGKCSLLLGWDGGGLGDLIGVPGIAELVTAAVDSAIIDTASTVNAMRTGPATVQPVLRAQRFGPSLSDDVDAIRFSASYHADRVQTTSGVDISCDEVDITLNFEAGIERSPGGISIAPGCHQLGDPGGFLQTNDGFTYDHLGVAYDVSVETSEWCVLPVADAVRSSISAAIPTIFRQAILDAALVDPALFGIPDEEIPYCTCDDDCNEFAPEGAVFGEEGGRRPRCHFEAEPGEGEGRCWIQLEVDRMNFRPEGLEAVLMEDDADRQLPLLERASLDALLCDDNRVDFTTAAPTMSTLPFPIVVPVP